MKATLKSSLLSLFIIAAMSCKQKEEAKKALNQNTSINKQDNNQPKYFYITLKAIFKKNDFVSVFYTQDQNEVFNANQVLTKEVEASTEIQDIIIEMPKEDYPYNIRLDLGSNKDQLSVVIDECVLHYGSKAFKIKAKDFPKYFNFNDGVVMNADSTSFTLKTYKSNNVDFYDPFIIGNDEMINVLMIEL